MASVMGLIADRLPQPGQCATRPRGGAQPRVRRAPAWRRQVAPGVEALAENLLLAVRRHGWHFARSAGLNLFLRETPVGLPRLSEIHLNPNVLLFSVLLTVGASLLSGLLPALRLLNADPQASLQQSSNRSIGSRQGNRLRRWLIGLQVAGCTALLLVTGLFSKSLLRLLGEEKGFDTSQIAVAEVRLTPQSYGKEQSRINFETRRSPTCAPFRAFSPLPW